MNNNLLNGLTISKSLYKMMLNQVASQAPEEACGLIAGQDGLAHQVFPISNELHSPTKFRMDAQEQIDAFLMIEKSAQELLAIYHSHPTGPEKPSETDRAEFAYPGVVSLIWFRCGDCWNCRAYLIIDDKQTEVELQLVEDE